MRTTRNLVALLFFACLLTIDSPDLRASTWCDPASGDQQGAVCVYTAQCEWWGSGDQAYCWDNYDWSEAMTTAYSTVNAVCGAEAYAQSSIVSGGDKFDSCGGRKSDSRQHGLAAG